MLRAIASPHPVPNNLVVRNGSKNPRHSRLGNRAVAVPRLNFTPNRLLWWRVTEPSRLGRGGRVLKCSPPAEAVIEGPEHPEKDPRCRRSESVKNL
jgi:hypothetical protein